MSFPLFDIAITTYERPDYVLAAVESCLSQGKHLNRVIVVDDGGQDDTGQRLAGLGDPRVLFHRRSVNGGMAMARHTALSLSTADWTIHLDDDWALLPGALEAFAELAASAPAGTVLLGSRLIWDHGGISPPVVPDTPLDYEGQIRWRNRMDGLWMDNLSAVSRLVRTRENWPAVRFGWYSATLFYLDAARHGWTVYSPAALALQKTCMINSDSRGEATSRLARRKLEAPGGVMVAKWLLERHGAAMVRHAPQLTAYILSSGAMYHLLMGQKSGALLWAYRALQIDPRNKKGWGIALFSLLGSRAFERAYILRQ